MRYGALGSPCSLICRDHQGLLPLLGEEVPFFALQIRITFLIASPVLPRLALRWWGSGEARTGLCLEGEPLSPVREWESGSPGSLAIAVCHAAKITMASALRHYLLVEQRHDCLSLVMR